MAVAGRTAAAAAPTVAAPRPDPGAPKPAAPPASRPAAPVNGGSTPTPCSKGGSRFPGGRRLHWRALRGPPLDPRRAQDHRDAHDAGHQLPGDRAGGLHPGDGGAGRGALRRDLHQPAAPPQRQPRGPRRPRSRGGRRHGVPRREPDRRPRRRDLAGARAAACAPFDGRPARRDIAAIAARCILAEQTTGLEAFTAGNEIVYWGPAAGLRRPAPRRTRRSSTSSCRPSSPPIFEAFGLHPALLDVATAFGGGMLSGGRMLPASYGRVRYTAPLPGALWPISTPSGAARGTRSSP